VILRLAAEGLKVDRTDTERHRGKMQICWLLVARKRENAGRLSRFWGVMMVLQKSVQGHCTLAFPQ
jgi:hypothetical protein